MYVICFVANVTCDVETFTMTVCYEPHADITLPDFSMFAEEYGNVEACKAVNIVGQSDTGETNKTLFTILQEIEL